MTWQSLKICTRAFRPTLLRNAFVPLYRADLRTGGKPSYRGLCCPEGACPATAAGGGGGGGGLRPCRATRCRHIGCVMSQGVAAMSCCMRVIGTCVTCAGRAGRAGRATMTRRGGGHRKVCRGTCRDMGKLNFSVFCFGWITVTLRERGKRHNTSKQSCSSRRGRSRLLKTCIVCVKWCYLARPTWLARKFVCNLHSAKIGLYCATGGWVCNCQDLPHFVHIYAYALSYTLIL